MYAVDDDYFLDRIVREVPDEIRFQWHGTKYVAQVPPAATLPAFLTVEGIAEPPPGDLVLVLRRRPRILDLFRRARLFQATVMARAV